MRKSVENIMAVIAEYTARVNADFNYSRRGDADKKWEAVKNASKIQKYIFNNIRFTEKEKEAFISDVKRREAAIKEFYLLE